LSRTSRITLAVLVALFALYFVARVRYAGKAPVKLQAQNCDSELWNHINQKERLRVIEACTAVEGRVVSLHRNSDGDVHIALDPERKSVLNLVNLIHAHGELVVEVICEHTPDDAANRAACGTFHSQITLPNAGDRIRVTGAYVTDRDNGWNEVHPVTRIEVLH
jgi:hypothetical protein